MDRHVPAGGFLLALPVGAVFVGALYLLPRPTAVAWVSDGGMMDLVGIVFYTLAAGLYVRAALRPGRDPARSTLWATVGVLAGLAFLEMAPPGWTLGKFIRHDAPTPPTFSPAHMVALGVPAVLALLTLFILFRNRSGFPAGLVRGKGVAWTVVFTVFLLGATLVLDRIQGGMGWPHPGWEHVAADRGAYFAVGTIEESAEVLIPLLLSFALFAREPSSVEDPGKEPGGSGPE